MHVVFIIDPRRRKGTAKLMTVSGEVVNTVECWTQTTQGRAYALDLFEQSLKLPAGERLTWELREGGR